jgi:27-O-demethylrifamycin SV methyltransferase
VASKYEPGSHYDQVTTAWSLLLGDDLHYGVFDGVDEDLATATGRLTALMVEAARMDEGNSVLDVGCGTGASACLLAREHGVSVLGITTSRVGVKEAEERAVEADVSATASFERRDGMDNGLADESFDRVWVLESSHLMRRRDALISECARVLRPGGRICLCDIILRRRMSLPEVRNLREPLALLREVFGDARMEPLPVYRELMEREGLVVDSERDLTAPTRPTFQRWRERAETHRAELLASFGESRLTAFVDSCAVLERFWDDGTLGYGLIAAGKP